MSYILKGLNQINKIMSNQTFTIGSTADALIGAGLVKLDSDIRISLGLIGFGLGLKVLVAFLNRAGVEVRSPRG